MELLIIKGRFGKRPIATVFRIKWVLLNGSIHYTMS